jgi:hypothetical protein
MQAISKSTRDNPLHIVMYDLDHRIFIHGIAIVPVGMTGEEAKHRMNVALQEAQARNPEEWTYEEVVEILKLGGFIFVSNLDEWKGE